MRKILLARGRYVSPFPFPLPLFPGPELQVVKVILAPEGEQVWRWGVPFLFLSSSFPFSSFSRSHIWEERGCGVLLGDLAPGGGNSGVIRGVINAVSATDRRRNWKERKNEAIKPEPASHGIGNQTRRTMCTWLHLSLVAMVSQILFRIRWERGKLPHSVGT